MGGGGGGGGDSDFLAVQVEDEDEDVDVDVDGKVDPVDGSINVVGGVTEDGGATGPMAKRAVVDAPGVVAPVVAPHLCRGISRTGNIGSDLLRMLREHRMRAILPLYLKTRKKMSSANHLHSRPEFQAFENSMYASPL